MDIQRGIAGRTAFLEKRICIQLSECSRLCRASGRRRALEDQGPPTHLIVSGSLTDVHRKGKVGFELVGPDKVEELCLLLNDLHVRLEMLREIEATEPNRQFDQLLE